MSYRSKQQQRGYSRPNPWLHGAPPGMGGSAGIGLQASGIAQPFNNQLVNQLALANNLLTSALTKNQNVFGNQGTGLLGSAPVNFGMTSTPLMQNMGLPMPQPKRMRMSNQGFNQRNRNNRQQNTKNRRDDRHDRLQRNNRPNKGKDSRNRKDEKRRSDNADDSRDDDEKSYDPASPTSDGEKGSDEESDENNEDSVRAGVKRARSPSPNSPRDKTKGGSLQVTIQHGSKGRSVSKDGESGSGSTSRGPLFCHVCNVSCMTQENFRRHMNGRGHKLRMDSLISLHEVKTKQLEASMKDYDHRTAEDSNRGRSRGGGYCNICKIRFSGSAVAHKRTKAHKKKKEHLYPFCRKCRIKHFKNREEYEEHCQSEDHKKACEEWNRRRVESGSAGSDDDSFEDGFITYDELDDDENESFADSKDDDKYNGLYSETPVGESFVVPLTCYYCNLCEKIYKKEELAKAHCQSKLHCERYEKQLQDEEEEQQRKEEEEEEAKEDNSKEDSEDHEMKTGEETKKESAEDEKTTEDILGDIDEILGDSEVKQEVDNSQQEEEESKMETDQEKSENENVKKMEDKTIEDNEINSAKATEEVKEEPENSDAESDGGKVTRSKSQESSPKKTSLRGPKARCSRGRAKK